MADGELTQKEFDEITAALEAEGMAAEGAPELPILIPSPGLRDLAAEADERNRREFGIPELPGVIPLSDLRERIAILTAAGVTRYRDAGVELQFDPEAQQKKDGRTEPKTERF